jgi:chromosome segregation ATPase
MSRAELEAKAELENIKRWRERLRPTCGDDEQALIDTLDGCTNKEGAAEAFIKVREEAKSAVSGLKAYKKQIEDAIAAHEARQERAEAFLHELLLATGQEKIKVPLGTVYIQAGREKVEILDESALDYAYFKPVVDTAKVKDALKRGEPVAGAQMIIGDPIISIRLAGKKTKTEETV